MKGRFRVRVIRSGLSLNGNYYSDSLLQNVAPMFEGVRVFVKSDREHLAAGGKDIRNLIGRIVAPEFVPGNAADQGEIVGTLELIDPTSEIGRKVTQAAARNMTDLFGLSIAVEGRTAPSRMAGRSVHHVSSFDKIHSVDLIVEPGAGGQVIHLIESAGPSERQRMTREQIIDLIKSKHPEAFSDNNPDDLSDEALIELLAQLMDGNRSDEATAKMREAVSRSHLPEVAKRRIIESFSARSSFTEADVVKQISAEASYLSRLGVGGGHVNLGPLIRMGESHEEKKARMLDAFFDPKDSSVVSIRECYRELTGDHKFTGRIPRQRLTEALDSAAFGDVLGDSITRRMIAEYNTEDIYGLWRDLVTIVPVNDFRTQERVRFGGYGDLPVVAEAAAYPDVTSPTDEKATYTVAKRGGLETITLEMIANDDVGAIQRIPLRLAQAAKRTLSEFVFNIPQANPAIFDGKALFHADHGNLGTAALSKEAVAAARILMKAQKEKDSNKKLGITPRFLWVPDELEEAAFDLFRRNENLDANFVQSLQFQVRPVWCWTNPRDWCLSADTRDSPLIELGFFSGQEEPELFIQDTPTAGSMFTNDQITYKIRPDRPLRRHRRGAAFRRDRGAGAAPRRSLLARTFHAGAAAPGRCHARAQSERRACDHRRARAASSGGAGAPARVRRSDRRTQRQPFRAHQPHKGRACGGGTGGSGFHDPGWRVLREGP